MKGRARSAEEEKLHDRIAALGCVACRQDGVFNTYVSIHHVHGRTRPDAHKHVLPLCHPHHQGDDTALAVHQNKTQWEARYGKQDDLVKEMFESMGLPYSPPGKKQSIPKIEKPLIEGTALKNTKAKKKKKDTAAEAKGLKARASFTSPKRKLTTAKPATVSKATVLPSKSMTKELTEAELAYRDEQKEVQKRMRAEAKAKYELQNREKIEADKEKARLLRKQFRHKMKAR